MRVLVTGSRDWNNYTIVYKDIAALADVQCEAPVGDRIVLAVADGQLHGEDGIGPPAFGLLGEEGEEAGDQILLFEPTATLLHIAF